MIENCGKKHYAKGLCATHYNRKLQKERYATDLEYRKKRYGYMKKYMQTQKGKETQKQANLRWQIRNPARYYYYKRQYSKLHHR